MKVLNLLDRWWYARNFRKNWLNSNDMGNCLCIYKTQLYDWYNILFCNCYTCCISAYSHHTCTSLSVFVKLLLAAKKTLSSFTCLALFFLITCTADKNYWKQGVRILLLVGSKRNKWNILLFHFQNSDRFRYLMNNIQKLKEYRGKSARLVISHLIASVSEPMAKW